VNEVRKVIRRTLVENQVQFTGVKIVSQSEISKLESMVQKNMEVLGVEISEGWKMPNDYHMTVKFGTLPLGMRMRGDVGKTTILQVQTLGVSDAAIALGVSGYMSRNENQHITLGFETYPSDSNKIKEWTPLPHPFELEGVVYEY
jgi:hypothetical protein